MKLNFLTIPSNKSYTLDKSFTDTTSIIDFKKNIEDSLRLNISNIVYDGIILDEDSILGEYGIDSNKCVILVISKNRASPETRLENYLENTEIPEPPSSTRDIMETILQSALNLDINSSGPTQEITTEITIPLGTEESAMSFINTQLTNINNLLEDRHIHLEPMLFTDQGLTAEELTEDLDDYINSQQPEIVDLSTSPAAPEPAAPAPEPAPPLPSVSIYQYQSQLNTIMSMGFVDMITIRQVLDLTGGNIEDALVYLS